MAPRPPSEPPITLDEIVELCRDPRERAKWRVLRKLPSLLGPLRYEDLTEEEAIWLEVQLALDDGYHVCPSCAAGGYGIWCGHCGGRFEPEQVECGDCGTLVVHRYCSGCGREVKLEILEDLKAGRMTWDELDRRTRVPLTPEEVKTLEAAYGRFWKDA